MALLHVQLLLPVYIHVYSHEVHIMAEIVVEWIFNYLNLDCLNSATNCSVRVL